MKTLKLLWAIPAIWLMAGAALAGVSSLPLDLTTGSNWRTAANPAIEADGQYGSAGYVLFGINLPDNSYAGTSYDIGSGNANNNYALPAYISAIQAPAGVAFSMWSGNGNFGMMQDPAAANAFTATPALLRDTRPADPCDLTLVRSGTNAFRLTVMMGVSGDGGYPNAGTTVTVDAGDAGSASGDTSAAPDGGATGTPGMMYLAFNVGAGTSNLLLRLAGSGANVAGIAFDPPATMASPLDLTTGSNWRTAANPEVEPDGAYGTAGYALFGINLPDNSYTGSGYNIGPGNANNIYSLPAFIASIQAPAGVAYSMWSGNGNFGQMQNPAAGNALTATTALLRDTRPVDPCDITIQRATNTPFRLTVIMGVSGDGGYPNAAATVSVDAGAAGSATGDTSAAPTGGAAGTPGMMYLTFDVGPATNDILLRLAGPGANLAGLAFDLPTSVVTPVAISRQPAGATCVIGIPFTLRVVASGTPPLSYQWSKGGVDIANGTNSTLAFPSLELTDAGTFTVVVSNSANSVTSSPAVLNVEPSLPAKTLAYQNEIQQLLTLVSEYPFDRLDASDAMGLHHGTLSGAAAFGAGPAGGADQALLLGGGGHVQLGPVADFEFSSGGGAVEAWVRADWSTAAPPPYNPCLFANRNGVPTRWSIHLLQGKDQLAFWNGANAALAPIPNAGTAWHHFASVFDAGTWRVYWDGMLVGTFTSGLGGSGGLPTQIGSASDASTAEGWVGALDEVAFYNFPLTSEEVTAHYNAFVIGDPPQITGEPVSIFALSGTAAQLGAIASGAQVSYQWYKNGSAVTDATNSTLVFASLADTDAGNYFAIAMNPMGSATSAVATVTVVTADAVSYRAVVQGESGLLSLYTFEASDATDALGTHSGSLVGSTPFAPGLGGANQALVLNGAGHAAMGAVGDFDFSDGNGTVEALVRCDWISDPGYAPCLFANRDGGPTRWSIHMLPNKSQLAFWNGANVGIVDVPNAGSAWHHLASVFDNGSWRVYWDGQLVGTPGTPLGSSPGPTQIGSASAAGTTEGWIGGLDEVAFYSGALSPSAISAHYSALVGPKLTIVQSGGQVTISWPVGAAGFILEGTDQLPAASWNPVPGVTGNSVTLPALPVPKYYRLRK